MSSYAYKPIEDLEGSTTGKTVHRNQRIYNGIDNELTESFTLIGVVSGSENPQLSSSYWDSLSITCYASGSSHFSSVYNNHNYDTTRLASRLHTSLHIDSYRSKFNDSSSIISIPQKYFGEGVSSGSFYYLNKAHPSASIILQDDGKGNLYAPNADISKSSASSISSSDNYVGNIIYPLGVAIITETGSYSHPTPSTGSITVSTGISASVAGQSRFSITSSIGSTIHFEMDNYKTDTSTIRYYKSGSSTTNTAISMSRKINDYFNGEHLSASSAGAVVTVTNDSNLLKSKMPTKIYSDQDNYPPITGSYKAQAKGFGGGKAPVLYTHIIDRGKTTYDYLNHFVDFKSTIKIFTREYTCKLNPGEFNVSMNPTSRAYMSSSINSYDTIYDYGSGSIDIEDSTTKKWLSPLYLPELTASKWSPYATTIGLYGKTPDGEIDHVPIMVGRFSKSLKTNRSIPIIIKIKFDI